MSSSPDEEQPAAHRPRLSEPSGAAKAAGNAALLHGVYLLPNVAEAVASAATGHADSSEGQHISVPRGAWNDERYRDRLRKDMRFRLLDQVIAKALVPVSLPAESLRYVRTYTVAAYLSDYTKDVAGAEVPEDGDWDTVIVELSVPVRMPGVTAEFRQVTAEFMDENDALLRRLAD